MLDHLKKKNLTGRVTYESELDHRFGETIASRAFGENLFGCLQCGTCSATCPLSTYMDYTPRKIIAMVRAGFKNEVLTNRTIWLCASCYSCTVECPKSIKITEVMYALKREAIMQGMYPKRFPVPILGRVFFNQVMNHGRLSEIWLMVKYFLFTNPFSAVSQLPLGFRLFKAGRLSLRMHGIADRKGLKSILRKVEEREEVAAS